MNLRLNKKALRYLRWAVKAAFLFIFVVPFSLIFEGQWVEVRSFLYAEMITMVPITQSPDSIWLSYYGNVNPGLWILEPFGGLQVLLTGRVEAHLLIPTIVAALIFTVITVLLGNVFCSWACPIGTMIDSFDMVVGKAFPKIEAKREKKRSQVRQSKYENKQTRGVCLICPLYKGLAHKNEVLAKGITLSALAVTVLLKFPAFCVICPIGIVSRGMIHLKSIKTALGVKGIQLILWLETFTIPALALLINLQERRYWCKHFCPVGALLGAVGTLNPFFKPRVKESECIMYGCPQQCKDYPLDYCGVCRLLDNKKCERVCPVNIHLVEHGPLARCTKCLECYISCNYNAITIDFLGRLELHNAISCLYKRMRHFLNELFRRIPKA